MEAINRMVGGLVLALIFMGVMTSPDQLNSNVDLYALQCLSGVMDIENGNETGDDYNDIRRLLFTGSVVLNRMESDA